MVEYYVILKRPPRLQDVCIFRDADMMKAIKVMIDYDKKNGFTIYTADGRFTIEDILIVEKEPVYDAPIKRKWSYHELVIDHK